MSMLELLAISLAMIGKSMLNCAPEKTNNSSNERQVAWH